jgi:hypothetical protein
MSTRTQYPFNASWYKYKTPAEINILRRQWNMFETVENYDFLIRAKMNAGHFGTRWYVFAQSSDQLDYNRGRVLHTAQYPAIDFTPERNKFVQQSTIYTKVSYETSQPSSGLLLSTSITEGERIKKSGNMSIYVQVSTYNATHKYKWSFSSEEDRVSYEKIAQSLRLL